MESLPTAAEITFSLRISSALNEKIVAEAHRQKRSRQAHIVYSLEKLFENAPAELRAGETADGQPN